MGDISRKLREKRIRSCVTPAYIYGIETTTIIEKQLDKLFVRITG